MGGTSTSKQTQSSSLAPYDPASGALTGILGGLSNMVPSAGSLSPTQSGAINQIVGNWGQFGSTMSQPAAANA